MKPFTKILSAIGVSIIAAAVVQAAPLTIANSGFESPDVGAGYTAGTPTSWTFSGSGSVFVGDGAPGLTAQEGTQIALFDTLAGSSTLSQVLPETVAANASYTVTVKVGHRSAQSWANSTAQLISTNTSTGAFSVLATQTATDPGAGAWTTLTLNASTVAADPSRNLMILLTTPQSGANPDVQVGWDQVTGSFEVAAVPEPSSLALLALGGAAAWGWRRARRS